MSEIIFPSFDHLLFNWYLCKNQLFLKAGAKIGFAAAAWLTVNGRLNVWAENVYVYVYEQISVIYDRSNETGPEHLQCFCNINYETKNLFIK